MNVVKAFCLLALLVVSSVVKTMKKGANFFDNWLPIEIVGFEAQGSPQISQLLIYGKNFGNDPSLINLKLGGVELES